MDVRYKTPANFYVCGQTQAGKSHLTRRMLRHLEELFYPVPTKIIYCYGEYQKKFDKFPPGKLSRTISLNSHYFVIFRNPRDSLGISTLAKQMFPGRTDYLMESFRDATSRSYGYLVIDCHQLIPENVRLRTNILPGERQIAYVKRT